MEPCFNYILKDKKPVPCPDTHKFAVWFVNADRRVGRDVINGYEILTQFYGIDFNLGKPPPLLFETIVFNEDDDELECDRYSTWQEAEDGHKKMVEKYQNEYK